MFMLFRYLASGDLMSSLAMSFRIGKSTVSGIIRNICEAIWKVLSNRVLLQLSSHKWKRIADEFFGRWNFPHCIGAIDGKHVVIQVYNLLYTATYFIYISNKIKVIILYRHQDIQDQHFIITKDNTALCL